MQSDVNNRKNKDSVGSKLEVAESPKIFALVKTHKHTQFRQLEALFLVWQVNTQKLSPKTTSLRVTVSTFALGGWCASNWCSAGLSQTEPAINGVIFRPTLGRRVATFSSFFTHSPRPHGNIICFCHLSLNLAGQRLLIG